MKKTFEVEGISRKKINFALDFEKMYTHGK